jgi:hypothetical protein
MQAFGETGCILAKDFRSDCKSGWVAVNGEIRHIVAEMDGGKHGSSHHMATFAPQNTAANTGAATVSA